MPKTLDITFVSDVVCPWCAIGLHALERALAQFPDLVVTRRVAPFELHPDMGPAGEALVPYLAAKYGMTAAQVAETQEAIRRRGAQVGFEFRMDRRTRTYNTFSAHRLLHWAGLPDAPAGAQWQLKKRLLAAHFTDGHNPGDADVLAAAAADAGLDPRAAREVIDSGRYADEVRAEERQILALGIRAVPATILDKRHLVSGGQPVEAFREAIAQAIG